MTVEYVMDPAASGDYGPRQNTPVDTIVIHTTEGPSIRSATDWWDHEDVVASAHYVLDGETIIQRVPEGDAAFHAGNRQVNRRSIGIEIVGQAGRRSTWTPSIMAQLVALTVDVVRRHAIPIVRQIPGIVGHCDVPDPGHPGLKGGVSHHIDPGPFFPWEMYLDTVRITARLYDALEAKEIA